MNDKKNKYKFFFNSNFNSSRTEIIPIISNNNDNKKNKRYPKIINILPVKNIVLFPGLVIPITAGKLRSKKLLEDSYNNNKIIGVITQKDINKENPKKKDLYKIGTISYILKLLKMPDNSITVILHGKKRFKIDKIIDSTNYLRCKIKVLEEIDTYDKEFYALVDSIKDVSIKMIKNDSSLPSEVIFAIKNIDNLSFLINFVTSNMNISIKKKQLILEENNVKKKSLMILKFLNIEYQKIKLKKSIQKKVKHEIDQQQKEYLLNQQIKAIQEELGDFYYLSEIKRLKEQSKNKLWSKEAEIYFNKELLKLKKINIQNPEYNIIKEHLEFILQLPWYKYSKDNFNLIRAIKILNNNHYGLDKIKDRILEYLSVLKLRGNMKAPILCFVGPPGVGKTSLGKSIAKVLDRKYIRVSLGGLHDESEIRGHRKTYVGALPGRILQCINKSGTSNPVFVLDEIDKIGIGVNGDPSTAMLEVLDPEQNYSFYDNYLEIGYDLSKILFIATANSLNNINYALLDRMEIINLSGYTIEEKIKIAKNFLLPKILKFNGMLKYKLYISTKKIEKIIMNYTYEAGIRSLERCISKIIRYTAKNIVIKKKYIKNITFNCIEKILGYSNSPNIYEKINIYGVTIGLAWTSIGGDILYIESILFKGKGNLTITGNIGKIMKESAIIAIKYLKSNYKKFNINCKFFDIYDIHLHVPEGAIPKDGPSAGITIFTSLLSLYTKKIIKPYIAMTGEITLRGKVLEVGGIKEKILAAKRAYLKYIILPKDNKKDIKNINKKYLLGLKFYFITYMYEIVKLVF
ncbi:MAG: endopeptidase La [Candidatus Shikimatogenerans bostrichidophilus]|nr:MAG: endopeptidase La [Candidatus Shikimatogenerans bostrichidophilus]